jgi:hypothetical protein
MSHRRDDFEAVVQAAAAAQQHEAVLALYKQASEHGTQQRLLSSLAAETYTCFLEAAEAVSFLLACCAAATSVAHKSL